jgi:hypothetical protein
MSLLQVLAARAADVDRLVFHTGTPGGGTSVEQALETFRGLGPGPTPTAALLDAVTAMGFAWGVGDGN